ncbi:MAG: hypothetical protein H7287_04845 [Thermoleophilia bacterium]|nr:hypothetical protein [Thermoleophilia bacterium]
MLLRRSLVAVAAITALLAVPALASAEPTVAPPSPLALQKFVPKFNFTLPPNEAVISITVGTSPVLDTSGKISSQGGTYLSTDADTDTSVTGSNVLAAGTYYWQSWWKTLPPNYASHFGAVNTFTIAPYVKAFSGTIQQYNYITAVNVDGQYVTNINSSKILCQVFSGRKVISSDSYVRKYNTIAGKNRFYCSGLKVSERLDGAKLKLKVTFISGGKARAVAYKAFIAR